MAKDKKNRGFNIAPMDIVDGANGTPVENESQGDIASKIVGAAESANEVNQLPEVHDYCSTGSTLLDLAIAGKLPGGIPIGRIVHVYGGGSTCKTVLGTTVLGYAQRTGKFAHMADIEHTLDPKFAAIYGLNCNDPKTFKLTTKLDPDPKKENSIEGMFDRYINDIIYPKGHAKKINDSPKIIVVDSVTALPSEVELEESLDASSYSVTRAKQMSRGFRKYIFPLTTSNTTLFCIDQTRDNLAAGPFGGKKEVTSGGRALEFYSSVQIYLKHDSNITNPKGVTQGIWVKFQIAKNKVSAPFRSGRFKITWEYGLDDISSNIYFLALDQLGKDAAKNRSEKVTIFGEEHQICHWSKVIEDSNREEELRQEVWKIWKLMYAEEPRKARVW